MAISKSLLDEIFADDDMGLLDRIELNSVKQIEEVDVADIKEKELNDWIKKHGREPSRNSSDVNEKMMAFRYGNIKKRDKAKIEEKEDEDPLSSPELDKMLSEMDDMGLTNFEGSIFTSPSEKKYKGTKERDSTDYSSKRTAMADFSVFEPIFNKAQSELDKKERTTFPFSAADFKEGRFFICGGLLCFIDKIYEPQRNKFGRMDRRVHVVFANHTESYMLFATFQKIMSEENGRTLTEPNKDSLGEKIDFNLKGEDVETGYIYILRSLSKEKEIEPYGLDFYKVGYTADTVEKRISNAVNEPTYLCAPVKIIEKWRCTNLNAKALETFLHRFLKDAQVRIMVNDKGRHQTASEWYNVPLGVLEVMVPMILDGSIRNYRYDSNVRKLVRIK